MASGFTKDALTKTVEFPKSLLAVEYVIENEEIIIFFSKCETYESEETLISEVKENAIFHRNNSKKSRVTNIIIIPLLFETTKKQKKSNWNLADDTPKFNWMIYKQDKVTKMLNDFEAYRAVVTCGYYTQEAPEFCCAGYFPSGDKGLENELIQRSNCPADQRVSEYAIYEIVKPYRYFLDEEILKTLN